MSSRESSAAAPAEWPPDQPDSIRRAWASPTGQAILKTVPPDKLWKLHERIERYAQNWSPEEVRAAWKQAKSTAQYRPPLDFFLIILDGKHSLDRSLLEPPPPRPTPAAPASGQKVLYDEMEWELVRIVEDTAYLKRDDIPGHIPVNTRWLKYV